MAPEVWFRNPDNYIRECVEVGVTRLTWDRGTLRKKSIDPAKHAGLYFPAGTDWRLLVCGDQGTAELRPGDTMDRPSAVYPTWVYNLHSIEELELMLEHPAGEDETTCGDKSIPADERPVLGQEHRVVVAEFPSVNTGVGRRFMAMLRELQEEFPEAIIHPHGLYSYRVAFGFGFRSVDMDPRTGAQKGKVTIPAGREMPFEETAKCDQWVTLLGFKLDDLKVPRNRCMFNIRSALWAAEHWHENVRFRVKGDHEVDPDSSTTTVATVDRFKPGRTPATVGDKVLCDTCSLQNTCKYFRAGAVCSVPNSEPARLARFFNTRDSGTIMQGLNTLMQTQANRLERGLDNEIEFGELDPEVSKIIDSLFKNGVSLAKLLDPSLRSQPKVQVGVQVGGGSQVAIGAAPQAGVAAIVAELEARGIPRSEITAEMLTKMLDGPDAIDVPALVEATDVEVG